MDDSHLHKEYKKDKLSIVDVRATLGTGEQVNVELQLSDKHDKQNAPCITGPSCTLHR
ncbi:PD-(D/E)XK nuclease family transposase [Bacillus toyonensis]|uniref:PD-(D/E)XK nuclease family transposase n=1 Tax=Bacillus toyonensis TaxID=155322 RepID=UPI002FFF124E